MKQSKTVRKSNIVSLKNNSALLFWEYAGSTIDQLKIPFDPSDSKWFQKVYEADDELKNVKTATFNEEECVMVIDEVKYCKLLKIEDNRLSVFKDYFVDSNFAVYSSENDLKAC